MSSSAFTRMLAAILSVDAVGYSRLMGIDEEQTLSSLEARRVLIRKACERHNGRMFGVAGDSMMAEFGNAADAVQAALDFQDGIAELDAGEPPERRLTFRAGINTGNVIVRGDSLFGDEVNIAARLQEMAAPGGVVLSQAAWHHARGRVAAQFSDIGEHALKNIGARIRCYAAERSDRPDIGADMQFISRGPAGAPAVAVLPFRAEGGDSELEMLGDGIAEDIIMGLSNSRWLPVIAKSSSFQFRDSRLAPVVAGRMLSARYVVTGSVAQAGGKLRVKAALEDIDNGRILWSQRYDHDASDTFGVQDAIGREIVALLGTQVDRAEQARTFQVPWEAPATWQLVQRGRWHMQRRTRRDTELAFAVFTQALANDPNSSAVLNELAWWHFWRAWLHAGEAADLERVVEYSRNALYMDSQDARPHANLGAVDIMRRRPASAIGHLDEALRINPSMAFAHSASGSARLLLGEPAKAVHYFQEADRLSPVDPYAFHNLGELAVAQCLAGDLEASIRTADRALMFAPGYFYPAYVKVGALARMGRLSEAAAEKRLFASRNPDFDAARMRWIPFEDQAFNTRLIAAFDSVSA